MKKLKLFILAVGAAAMMLACSRQKEDKTVIALTPTCPAVNKQPLSVMEKLVEDGLGNTIYEYSKTHPYIVKEYKEGFPVLMEF